VCDPLVREIGPAAAACIACAPRRDLQRRKQESNEQNELFQKSDHHEDQSDDCSESAKTFKKTTTHKFSTS
jgi:hypothetical protein